MIIFDLDGTLADCEHRRHFVDPSKREDCYFHFPATLTQSEGWYYKDIMLMCHPPKAKKFIPDWKEFYEACEKDLPIRETIGIFNMIWQNRRGDGDVVIWSGRSESVRYKTEQWIDKHLSCGGTWPYIKMRPIGDFTPDDELKEKWLEETYESDKWGRKTPITMVFDDRPKVIRMWQSHGIFVFNCNQDDKEF